MGNSLCCNNNEKIEIFITKSELNVDSIENINEKEINNNQNSNINTKNDYINKSITSASPEGSKDINLINPLPEIVIVKRNKKYN